LKKKFDILLIVVTIGVIGFVGLTIFGISIMGTKTDAEYFEKQKRKISESNQKRILYSYGLDTLNWEDYVLKRKVDMILRKTERDSTITFQLFDVKDTLDNYGFTQYVKHDESIYIVGEKHKIIERNKYLNKEISNIAFDLYDAVEPPTDWNGPFLFNMEYGILNIEAWSAGRKLFILPTDYNSDIISELLDKEINAEKNER
jgi:hypothetical protein